MQCPICHKPVQWEDNPSRPFCSERCKMIDLGKWVDEEYKVPSGPNPVEDYVHQNSQDPDSDDSEF